MKNNKLTASTILSLAILTMFLTALLLPVAQCFDTPDTHGHYTITEYPTFVAASRCDHLVNPPGADPDNAFTSCGIFANLTLPDHDAYNYANYTFVRGYGGPYILPHTWICGDLGLMCGHQVETTTNYVYDYREPVWNTTSWQWNGYYQPDMVVHRWNLDAYTVGGIAGSYFANVSNPNQLIYISSPINANYMYAENPAEISWTY